MKENNMRKIKILIIEDEDSLRKLSMDFLSDREYIVFDASCIEDASKIVANNPPDLILSEMTLQGKSGLDFLKEIRADKILKNTGFIMMIGYGDKINEALDAGADDFFKKPFDLQELDARIKQYINKRFVNIIKQSNSANQFKKYFVDFAPFLCWVKDAEGYYVFLNQTYIDILINTDKKPDDLIGMRDEHFFLKEQADIMVANDKITIEVKKPRELIEEAPCSKMNRTIVPWYVIKWAIEEDGKWYAAGIAINMMQKSGNLKGK